MPKASNDRKIDCIHSQEQLILKSNINQLDNSISFYDALKPKGYAIKLDINPLEFIREEKPVAFVNKQKFLKQRKKIVKSIKAIVDKHSLSIQTLFLAIAYFDLICSKMSSFNELELISKLCLILAAKYADDGLKAYRLEKAYRSELSSHYQDDEMFIVKLLDYKLNLFTTYDFLSQLMMCGIIFNNETNDVKKVDFMYNTVIKIALLFIESNLFLELSQSKIAFGIVGFTRKLLGLEACCPQIEKQYHVKSDDQFYIEGLRVITETFKVKSKKECTKDKKGVKISTMNNSKSKKNKEEYVNNNQYHEMTEVY